MRTFIAIDFPPETLTQVEKLSSFFKQKTPANALKWVGISNFHLTISFLGEIDEKDLPAIKAALDTSLAGIHPFSIQIKGLGMFPNAAKPRVVWLGIDGADPLMKINRKINISLRRLDIQPDPRPFSPHITIARVHQGANTDTAALIGSTLSKYRVDPLGEVNISQIHLYKSVLLPSGSIYSILHTVQLNQV